MRELALGTYALLAGLLMATIGIYASTWAWLGFLVALLASMAVIAGSQLASRAAGGPKPTRFQRFVRQFPLIGLLGPLMILLGHAADRASMWDAGGIIAWSVAMVCVFVFVGLYAVLSLRLPGVPWWRRGMLLFGAAFFLYILYALLAMASRMSPDRLGWLTEDPLRTFFPPLAGGWAGWGLYSLQWDFSRAVQNIRLYGGVAGGVDTGQLHAPGTLRGAERTVYLDEPHAGPQSPQPARSRRSRLTSQL